MWVGTHTDIQHIKEEQIQKDNFISKVSHELRTPVTIIKTYSSLLQQKLSKIGNNEEIQIIIKIEAQLRRLNNLIIDLLDINNVIAGKLSINKSKFNFNALVAETIENIQLLAPKNKIIFRLTPGPRRAQRVFRF